MKAYAMNRFKLILLFASIAGASCGPSNAYEDFVEITDEERAHRALNNGRFDQAIDIYLQMIEDEPTEYRYLTLIAAALAARSGIDLVRLVDNSINPNLPLFEQILDFVPNDPTEEQLADISVSVQYLQMVPPDLTDSIINASANLQITLYASSHAAMVLSKFYKRTVTNQLDPEALDQMTDDDADMIIQSLTIGASSGDTGVGNTVGNTLDAINSADGFSSSEKLKAFLILNG